MADKENNSEHEDKKPEWLEMLSHFMGQDAENLTKKISNQGFNSNFQSFIENGSGLGFQQLQAQLQSLFTPVDGPINWSTAQQVAIQVLNQDSTVPLTATEADAIRKQLAVADLWLDAVTDLTPPHTTREVWDKKQWLVSTLPAWKQLCDPVILKVTDAIVEGIKEQLSRHGLAPEDMKASAAIPGFGEILSPMNPAELLDKLGANIFAIEIGKAMGQVAQKAFGSTDLGIPLTGISIMGLVPSNIKDFATDLDIDETEITQFLAVREAAHARLFNAVSWLRHHLNMLLKKYAQTIVINHEAVEESIQNMQEKFIGNTDDETLTGGMNLPLGIPLGAMSNMKPEEMGIAVPLNLFKTDTDGPQGEALSQLQALLAVIEGWVDEVSMQACLPHLSSTYALRELLRRHRAVTCPIEKVLKPIIGMELSPKEARNAAKICQILNQEKGAKERDAIWAHPHKIPTAKELTKPEKFLKLRQKALEETENIDKELNSLLEGNLGWAKGLSPDMDSEGDNIAGEQDS